MKYVEEGLVGLGALRLGNNVHVHFQLKRIKQDMTGRVVFFNLQYTVFKLCGYKLSHSVHSGICELVIQTYFWHKRRNHDLIVV